MKSPDEIRQAAKARTAEINAGKDPGWTPINRAEAIIYVSAYENGYNQALADLKHGKPKTRA